MEIQTFLNTTVGGKSLVVPPKHISIIYRLLSMSNIQLSASLVEGIIYQPKHISPKGGIVLLHGSEGGSAKWIDVIAVLLAANGFLTMPKSYNKIVLEN